mgnify:CR=1 FL=1
MLKYSNYNKNYIKGVCKINLPERNTKYQNIDSKVKLILVDRSLSFIEIYVLLSNLTIHFYYLVFSISKFKDIFLI